MANTTLILATAALLTVSAAPGFSADTGLFGFDKNAVTTQNRYTKQSRKMFSFGQSDTNGKQSRNFYQKRREEGFGGVEGRTSNSAEAGGDHGRNHNGNSYGNRETNQNRNNGGSGGN